MAVSENKQKLIGLAYYNFMPRLSSFNELNRETISF